MGLHYQYKSDINFMDMERLIEQKASFCVIRMILEYIGFPNAYLLNKIKLQSGSALNNIIINLEITTLLGFL